MPTLSSLPVLSQETETLLAPPFEWRPVKGGIVRLENALETGGTPGGEFLVTDFAVARYLITNAQYQKFIADPLGFADPGWWEYSPQATQWHKDHPRPKPTAFDGSDLPRTRVSWFDSLAFCAWLSSRLQSPSSANRMDMHNPLTWRVRLPTEPEWQRAALGDTGWRYVWGDELAPSRANYAKHVGRPIPVGSYPEGQSPFGALDMVGNVWEWCLTPWGVDSVDLTGYVYRHIKGGAWNVSNLEHLSAASRGGNSPRGQLNDCGFRCVYVQF